MLIKGGTIIDGTSKPKFGADIRIEGDTIKEIGKKLDKQNGEETLNAKDMYVAPGFVDILNHSDAYMTLFNNPAQNSLLYQGITTILTGNCGSSLAPLVDGTFINSIQKWGDPTKINVNWLTMKEYLQELKKIKFGPNIATLVGHSTVRRGLVGDEARPLKQTELQQMEYMIEEALKQGAFGVSTGLAYTHAREATAKELRAVMRIVKKYNGLYSTHIRNEADKFLDSIKEVVSLVKETDVNAEISHLKVVEKNNWDRYDEALKLIDGQKNINFDIYPYKTTASVLYSFLPKWASEKGNISLLPNIKNSETKKRLIEDMQKDPYSYEDMRVAMGAISAVYFGKKISEIAKNQNLGPEETALSLILASNNRVVVFVESISEENLLKGLAHKKSFISSGGAGYNEEDTARSGKVHPRYFGAMPKFLAQHVLDKKLMSWEEAIHKMTLAPAQKIGIKNRGELKAGNFADLVIINPKTISSKATFEHPYKYPLGIKHVIVNGKVATDNNLLKELNGRVLIK